MTEHTRWGAIDQYIDQLFHGADPVLDEALQAAAEAGLPKINVTAVQGNLLQILALSIGARRILEIGTLGGYSTIWLARALPEDGHLLSLEYEPRHAAVARSNLERAGLAGRVEVRVGRGLDLLPQLAESEPFDLVFIDADKPSYPGYLDWAVRLTHRGSLIVADNTLQDGAVTDASSTDATVVAIQRFNAAIAADRRLSATLLPMTRGRGLDGMTLAVVR